MRKALIALWPVRRAVRRGPGVRAANPIKIGLIMPYSGQFADTAAQMDNAIKLYVKLNGDTVAGRKVEFIRKDTGGIAPDVAKRLAQELVVRDNVDILAGFVLTPNAMAAGDVSAEAKKFMVVMNAATAIITTKSPYMARTGSTVPQNTETLGTWAATKGGVKKAYTMVSDYGPGHDAEQGFIRAFKEAGGEIVGSVRFPVANPDFSAFVQRAKDLNPEAIFIFVPGGAQPAAIGKALAERGIDPSKTKVHGHGRTDRGRGAQEHGRRGARDHHGPTTTITATIPRRTRSSWRRSRKPMAGATRTSIRSAAMTASTLIYEALKKTGGKADGDALIAAAKGMKWESPRGPISIDPETRDIVQTIYIRRVEKAGGDTRNVEFDKVENVKDPVKARMKTN